MYGLEIACKWSRSFVHEQLHEGKAVVMPHTILVAKKLFNGKNEWQVLTKHENDDEVWYFCVMTNPTTNEPYYKMFEVGQDDFELQ